MQIAPEFLLFAYLFLSLRDNQRSGNFHRKRSRNAFTFNQVYFGVAENWSNDTHFHFQKHFYKDFANDKKND